MKWRSHKQRGVGTVSEGPVQPAPSCCHAKTAALTGTVPLFTPSTSKPTLAQGQTWPPRSVSYLMKITLLPQICEYAQLADDFKGNKCEPQAPVSLITEKHSLNL